MKFKLIKIEKDLYQITGAIKGIAYDKNRDTFKNTQSWAYDIKYFDKEGKLVALSSNGDSYTSIEKVQEKLQRIYEDEIKKSESKKEQTNPTDLRNLLKPGMLVKTKSKGFMAVLINKKGLVISDNARWIVVSEQFDENLVQKSCQGYNIEAIYGYSEYGDVSSMLLLSTRKEIWKREKVLKEYTVELVVKGTSENDVVEMISKLSEKNDFLDACSIQKIYS